MTRGAPLRLVDIEAELLTPTGAAILTTLASGYGTHPTMSLVGTGYGAGQRDLPFANVLGMALVILEAARETARADQKLASRGAVTMRLLPGGIGQDQSLAAGQTQRTDDLLLTRFATANGWWYPSTSTWASKRIVAVRAARYPNVASGS